jgi:hypothetical protein
MHPESWWWQVVAARTEEGTLRDHWTVLGRVSRAPKRPQHGGDRT